jgi:hypothetical protein
MNSWSGRNNRPANSGLLRRTELILQILFLAVPRRFQTVEREAVAADIRGNVTAREAGRRGYSLNKK